jgi:hypothetical protein
MLKWNEKVPNTAVDYEPMLTIAAEGDFDGVARSIADSAPEWIMLGLSQAQAKHRRSRNPAAS